MKFANRLKELRTNKKLTQEELANRIGVGKSLISMYEKGTRNPSIENLEKLADEFNVDLDYLMGNTQYTTKIISSNSPIPNDYFTTPEEAINFLLNQKVIMAYTGVDIDTLSDDEKIQFANRLLDYTKLLGYDYKND